MLIRSSDVERLSCSFTKIHANRKHKLVFVIFPLLDVRTRCYTICVFAFGEAKCRKNRTRQTKRTAGDRLINVIMSFCVTLNVLGGCAQPNAVHF